VESHNSFCIEGTSLSILQPPVLCVGPGSLLTGSISCVAGVDGWVGENYQRHHYTQPTVQGISSTTHAKWTAGYRQPSLPLWLRYSAKL